MNWKRVCFGMWCFCILLAIAACGDSNSGNQSNEVNVSALLTRSQENPAFTNFSSSGSGTLTVNSSTGEVRGVIVTNGIFGTEAHIHSGAPGVSGPIEIPLVGGPTIWTIPAGTVMTSDQLTKLNSGLLYYNVHSPKAPMGEIRGQLTQKELFASLTGANETPANTSTATGTGVLGIDPSTGRIRGFIKTTGITGTAAHIHSGAVGVSGPVVVPLTLTETGGTTQVWGVPEGTTLTASQIASFNAGELYYNVHTAAFPNGEIRGQLMPATLTIRDAYLTGLQETPPVTTPASAIGTAVVNSVTREIYGDVITEDITGTVAHIHEGAFGVAGPVVVNMDKLTSLTTAILVEFWTARETERVLTSALLTSFNAGNLYFNVHSAANPNGEIRGQIIGTPKVFTINH